jgi:peroxiredoxin
LCAYVFQQPASILLFVFGTRCQYCKRNLTAWESILPSAVGGNVKTAAISVDSLDATLKYIQENKLQFPVFVSADPSRFKRSNGIAFVPQTLLLGRDGKVEKVWPGVLADSTIAEVAIAISAHDTEKR